MSYSIRHVCVDCKRTYNINNIIQGTTILRTVCPECEKFQIVRLPSQTHDKGQEIVNKTCSSCKTRWGFIHNSVQSECPYCKQPFDSTETGKVETYPIPGLSKEDYLKTVDSLIKDIEIETNGLLAKAAENKLRLSTLRILRETLK